MNDLALYENVETLKNNYPIKIHIQDAREEIESHWHEYLELLFFRTDGCRIRCGSKMFEPRKNDCIAVNCNELHSIEPNTSGSFFCIMINPSFFSDVAFENILFESHIRGDETVRECFDRIFIENEAKQEGYDIEIKSLAYHLVAHILRNYKIEHLSENEVLLRKNKTHIIGEVLLYISNNYNTKLTTSSLAKKFHLNEYYFCTLFKSQTGQSPLGYINRYRIEKATVLLKNSSRSITETALSVGFDDSNYFSRIFKKYMGVSPRAYKKDTEAP